MKLIKRILLNALDYLNKKNTRLGRIVWILNCILLLVFANLILKILLSSFGYLYDFIFMVSLVFQFLIATILYSKETSFFPFMDNHAVSSHIVSFLILITIYFFSINHLWKNKENYIKP